MLYIVYIHIYIIHNMCKIRKYMDLRICIRILYVSVCARGDVGQRWVRWRPTKFHDLFAVSGNVLTHFCCGKRAGSSCPDQVHHFSDSSGFLFKKNLVFFLGTYALHWIERAEFWVAKVARKEGNTEREREREREREMCSVSMESTLRVFSERNLKMGSSWFPKLFWHTPILLLQLVGLYYFVCGEKKIA
jgi:hypothetical protein